MKLDKLLTMIKFRLNQSKDKLIVIEFKSFGVSDKNKISGVPQLLEYIEIINKNMIDVKERWYYLITTIDPSFGRTLERNNFKPIFSNKQSGYFQYYSDELIQSNIYVLDIESLVYDSNLRNQAFMDIFKEPLVEFVLSPKTIPLLLFLSETFHSLGSPTFSSYNI